MRFLILFIFLTINVFANDVSEIKNIVIHKDPKVYDNVIFLDKNDKKDFDKAAEDLRLATRHLGMIVGKVDVEEILGSIFNDFCIGK